MNESKAMPSPAVATAGDANGTVPVAEPGRDAADEPAWLRALRWDENGLMPAIAQDAVGGRVLMVAWMNREALLETVRTGRGVYWSRSRGRLWRKGEESGNWQEVHEVRTDCDADVILLSITQRGGVSCHTGRESCFFRRLDADGAWQVTDPVKVDPARLYGSGTDGHGA